MVDRSCQATEEDIAQCLAALAATTQPKSPKPTDSSPLVMPPVRGHSSHHTVDINDFERVCEDMVEVGRRTGGGSGTDHEDFFSRKFDQLAKLHDLYQSVSSITARCQSRMVTNGGGGRLAPQQKSASFSLSGLLLTNLDSLSLPSNSSSDDVNSLCSEPAWGLRHHQLQQGGKDTGPLLDWNRNTSLRSLDLFPTGGGEAGSLSLSNLAFPPVEDNNEGQAERPLTAEPAQMLSDGLDQMQDEERCDSPILEGIDSELAKYAQLRDLQQAYQPGHSDERRWNGQLGGRLAALRHPDGASNPNLGGQHLESSVEGGTSDLTGRFATLPRRSPGNGRSSSGSDPDELVNHHHQPNDKRDAWTAVHDGSLSKDDCHEVRRNPSPMIPSQNGGQVSCVDPLVEPKSSASTEKVKKTRVAKFSRLISTVRKISRSPSQVNKTGGGGEEKLKTKTTKSFLQGKQQPGSAAVTTALDVKQTTEKLSKSSSSCSKNKDKASKNVKGTLLSGRSGRPELRSSTDMTNSSSRPGSRTRSQGVNAVVLPSPYSFPSRPVAASHHHRRQPQSETSGSDSGVDCLPTSLMRGSRGKGAKNQHSNSNNNTLPSLNSSLSRRSQCFSSGYESIGLDTESIDSYPPPPASNHLLTSFASPSSSSPVPILDYDQGLVSRLDRSWRFQEVTRLKKQQEQLKAELSTAKSRINVDPNRWSFDLYTEASGLEPTDPSFVEAFQKETHILGKRVAACQAHVALTTCFDRKPVCDGAGGGEEEMLQQQQHSCCTADCDPYWMCQDKMEKVLGEM